MEEKKELGREEKLIKAENLIKEINSLELTEDDLNELNTTGGDIGLNYINKNNGTNNSGVITFHKNVDSSFPDQ